MEMTLEFSFGSSAARISQTVLDCDLMNCEAMHSLLSHV